MSNYDSKKVVKGALLLTLAGLISKVLSAGYRIPLQNLTGDLGFYIYQQIYPILGIVLVLALYGFPSTISKITSDLKAEGKSLSFATFYMPLAMILVIINSFIFLFLYLNAESIALWMGDLQLTRSLKYTAFSFLFIPFIAILRGSFQGENEMKPTAFSQLGEQLVRVTIIIIAAVVVVALEKDIYLIGQAAALASIAGAGLSLIILSIFFIKKKPWGSSAGGSTPIPWNYYVRIVVMFGIVGALNHMVLLIIQFADTFTLVPSLMEYGLSQLEAMKLKGVFDRGQPLIQLGTVLGSSFALALIPSISITRLQNDPTTFYHYIQTALSFSFYLAVGATTGLIIIFPEVNRLLFQSMDGTTSLQVLVIAILLCSVAITATSILQGLGYIKRTALFIFISFFVKWTANQLLVPLWGITGSAIATILSLFVLCVLVLFELHRKLPMLCYFRQIKWRALIIASISMASYLFLIKYIISPEAMGSRVGILVYVLGIISTGAMVYTFLLLKCKAFSKRELAMLPFASIFIRLQKGRN